MNFAARDAKGRRVSGYAKGLTDQMVKSVHQYSSKPHGCIDEPEPMEIHGTPTVQSAEGERETGQGERERELMVFSVKHVCRILHPSGFRMGLPIWPPPKMASFWLLSFFSRLRPVVVVSFGSDAIPFLDPNRFPRMVLLHFSCKWIPLGVFVRFSFVLRGGGLCRGMPA